MDNAETWIATATAALRGSAGQLRESAAKLNDVADYLESVADQAPPAQPSAQTHEAH